MSLWLFNDGKLNTETLRSVIHFVDSLIIDQVVAQNIHLQTVSLFLKFYLYENL